MAAVDLRKRLALGRRPNSVSPMLDRPSQVVRRGKLCHGLAPVHNFAWRLGLRPPAGSRRYGRRSLDPCANESAVRFIRWPCGHPWTFETPGTFSWMRRLFGHRRSGKSERRWHDLVLALRGAPADSHPASGVVEDATALASEYRLGLFEGSVTERAEALGFAGQSDLAVVEYPRPGHRLQLRGLQSGNHAHADRGTANQLHQRIHLPQQPRNLSWERCHGRFARGNDIAGEDAVRYTERVRGRHDSRQV